MREDSIPHLPHNEETFAGYILIFSWDCHFLLPLTCMSHGWVIQESRWRRTNTKTGKKGNMCWKCCSAVLSSSGLCQWQRFGKRIICSWTPVKHGWSPTKHLQINGFAWCDQYLLWNVERGPCAVAQLPLSCWKINLCMTQWSAIWGPPGKIKMDIPICVQIW